MPAVLCEGSIVPIMSLASMAARDATMLVRSRWIDPTDRKDLSGPIDSRDQTGQTDRTDPIALNGRSGPRDRTNQSDLVGIDKRQSTGG